MTSRSKPTAYVYVAGAMSAPRSYQWVNNCLAPLKAVNRLQQVGAAVHCPLLQGVFFHNDLSYDKAMRLDIAWLALCDYMYVECLTNWEDSKGVREEMEFANQNGIEVFFDLEELLERIEGK